MKKKFWYIVAVVLAVLCIAAVGYRKASVIGLGPMESAPDNNADVAGTTAKVAIADCTSTVAGKYQRLRVTNVSTVATHSICHYPVAAAAACGSSVDCDLSGTDDGRLVMYTKVDEFAMPCSLRLCIVGSASPIQFHVSREEL